MPFAKSVPAFVLGSVLAAGLCSSAIAQPADTQSSIAIPRVARVYVGPARGLGAGQRVEFEQDGAELVATWTVSQGGVYSRSKMTWQPEANAFAGTSVMRTACSDFGDDSRLPIDYTIREEIQIIDEFTIRNRWTKPLRVDCELGVVEVFKWYEVLWRVPETEKK